MKAIIICAGVASAALLSACHPKNPPEHVDQQQQGREETQGIRNTEAIGYAGNAIGDKVDAALDANDQAKQKMDDAIDAQTQ